MDNIPKIKIIVDRNEELDFFLKFLHSKEFPRNYEMILSVHPKLRYYLESNKDDLFVIPVFQGKYDYSTFRVLARKSVFLEWKGTGQAVYDPSIVPEIRKRFKSYCKVDFLESKDRNDFVETCKANYLNNTEDDFRFLNILLL
mgnify:CR=1 FL=1